MIALENLKTENLRIQSISVIFIRFSDLMKEQFLGLSYSAMQRLVSLRDK